MKDEITAFCLEHGMSPTRFAIEAGISHSTVSRWLQGKTDLTDYSRKCIRRYLDSVRDSAAVETEA